MQLLNPGSSLVVEAFAFDITNRSLSPFDACVAFESIPGHMAPFSELRSDALFMHSIMATGTALHDFAIKTPGPTRQTAVQLHNTLSLLRVKLLDPLAYREEAVVHAVLSLAMLAGGFGHWGATVVHLDIDPAEISKLRDADIPVVGPLAKAVEALAAEVSRHRAEGSPAPDAWLAQLRAWREEFPLRYGESDEWLKPQKVVETLQALTAGEDVIVTTGVGQHQMWAAQHYRWRTPRSMITSGGLGVSSSRSH